MYEKNDPEGFINKDTKAIILDFIGGEPFLNIDIIDFTVEYFMNQCLGKNHPWLYTFKISISTNGDLYFTDKV